MTEPLPPSNLTILDRVGYTYFETDLQGNLTSVNDALCRVLGYSRDELVGRPFNEIGSSNGNGSVFETVLQTRQTLMDIEYNLRRNDGAFIFAEGGVSLKVDGDGQVIGFRGVLHDITIRKQVETNLQQANERFEREMEVGRHIQNSFLPSELPQVEGWELAAAFQAARHVSGDFYDAFTLADGRYLGVIVADVCDKGVGAALFMALIRSLLRAYTDQFYSPGWLENLAGIIQLCDGEFAAHQRLVLPPAQAALRSAVSLTNTYLLTNHEETGMFATVFYGLLEPTSGKLVYINAGHEPPFLLSSTGIAGRLNPTGPAVGLIPEFEYRVDEVTLEPGHTLLAYTDGVVDVLSESGLPFNMHRLEVALEQPIPSASGRLDDIMDRLRAHISGADQYDDITLLALRKTED